MNIDSNRLRELRLDRQWSQEQLATLSGLNLRTIQRLEAGAKTSNESLRALASVFEVPAESLLMRNPGPGQTAFGAMQQGITSGALDFSGTTSRPDFWWFALGVAMFLAVAALLSDAFGPLLLQLASLLIVVPWVAACTRRLRDAGLSPWWQLISLVPVAGIVVLLYLLTLPARSAKPVDAIPDKTEIGA